MVPGPSTPRFTEKSPEPVPHRGNEKGAGQAGLTGATAAALTARVEHEKPKRPSSLKKAPKFARGDIVLLSLFDEQGMPRNQLAREAAGYYSQSAEVITLAISSVEGNETFVYGVQTDDGNVFELTETCLMAFLSF